MEYIKRTLLMVVIINIILAPPIYASETKKISSVNIQRVYKAREGEIDISQVSFNPFRSDYSVSYTPMFLPSDITVGSYMDYQVSLTAKKGCDFEWLKERNCISDSGTIKNLTISENNQSCSFILHTSPLPMILNKPANLRWNGTCAEWDPVEYADFYTVTVYTIEKNGNLHQRGSEIVSKHTSYDVENTLYAKPGDYIFKVEAESNQNYLFPSKKSELAYNRSKLLDEEDIGHYTGYWYEADGIYKYRLSSTERASLGKEYLTYGRYLINGDYYSFNESGERISGWQEFNNQWSYHDLASGKAVREWLSISGKTYYLDPMTSIMVTGWRTIDNKRYYFKRNGEMVSGWQRIDGKIFLFGADGSQNTNTVIIHGKTYSFQSDGSLIQ